MRPLALFTAGGPGAGKSELVRGIVAGTDLVSLDPDTILDEIAAPGADRNALLPEAFRLLEARQAPLIAARRSIVINTTAADLAFVTDLRARLVGQGYRAAMIFVAAPLDRAIARNAARRRPVPLPVLHAKHEAADANRTALAGLFGTDFVMLANAGTLADLAVEAARLRVWLQT